METIEILEYPKPNIELIMGEAPADIVITFRAEKTLLNRFKYWMFSKFFPFKVRWL